MVTTRPPRTIVKPTALGQVANTDTKLLIYSLFQKGRVLAQDGRAPFFFHEPRDTSPRLATHRILASRRSGHQPSIGRLRARRTICTIRGQIPTDLYHDRARPDLGVIPAMCTLREDSSMTTFVFLDTTTLENGTRAFRSSLESTRPPAVVPPQHLRREVSPQPFDTDALLLSVSSQQEP